MKLDKNSYGTIACAWLVSAGVIFLVRHYIHVKAIVYPVTALFGLYALFVTWFHRVPVRHMWRRSLRSTAPSRMYIPRW